jgi:Flp pilus assembly protein TadD
MASIGAILAQQGQLNPAIDILQKALKIDPENPTAKQNLQAALKKRSP